MGEQSGWGDDGVREKSRLSRFRLKFAYLSDTWPRHTYRRDLPLSTTQFEWDTKGEDTRGLSVASFPFVDSPLGRPFPRAILAIVGL